MYTLNETERYLIFYHSWFRFFSKFTTIKDYGIISFSKIDIQNVELRGEDLNDFPGIQAFWQLELAPLY